jgi:hypothetical protein
MRKLRDREGSKMKKFQKAEGICSGCGNRAIFRVEDLGIGSYEFWGAKGTNHDYQWISSCCSEAPKGEVEEIER